MEVLACFLKYSSNAIVYYPGVCSPSISLTIKNCKLSLLANVSQSSDPTLQELTLQLDLVLECFRLTIVIIEFLLKPGNSWTPFLLLRNLTTLVKKLQPLKKKLCVQKLDFLSVQCKFKDAAFLETSIHLWNRLLFWFHPGELLFILRASFDTLQTPMNLRRWKV